ncbi:hypothetical protein ACLKA7_015473 [Drosophila subpalustris]
MNEWTLEREREGIKGKWETSKTPGDILNVAQKNDYRLSRCNRHKTTDNKWDTVVGGGERKELGRFEVAGNCSHWAWGTDKYNETAICAALKSLNKTFIDKQQKMATYEENEMEMDKLANVKGAK